MKLTDRNGRGGAPRPGTTVPAQQTGAWSAQDVQRARQAAREQRRQDERGEQQTAVRDEKVAAQAQAHGVSVVMHADRGVAVPEAQRVDPGDTGSYADLRGDDLPIVKHVGTPVISLKNVSVIYPSQEGNPALSGINVDIWSGEFVFIVGHSGSGKSTFIRLLTREQKATQGEVIVAGQDLTTLRDRRVPYLRRQIGCVFQDYKLLPDKTAYDNVAFALQCIGRPRKEIESRVPEVLTLVGLGDRQDAYPDQLSGGEQQRIAIARAMVNRPPLLVCDEPTGNLDPGISLGIMRLLDRINRMGTTVVMATHDHEIVDAMRRRVIALDGGHMVRDIERGGYDA